MTTFYEIQEEGDREKQPDPNTHTHKTICEVDGNDMCQSHPNIIKHH